MRCPGCLAQQESQGSKKLRVCGETPARLSPGTDADSPYRHRAKYPAAYGVNCCLPAVGDNPSHTDTENYEQRAEALLISFAGCLGGDVQVISHQLNRQVLSKRSSVTSTGVGADDPEHFMGTAPQSAQSRCSVSSQRPFVQYTNTSPERLWNTESWLLVLWGRLSRHKKKA